MKKILVLLALVLGVIPTMWADISVQTKIFDGSSQPPIVGGVIDDYSEGNISKKGIIVSVNNDNLFYDAELETSNPYFYEDLAYPNNTYSTLVSKDFRIIDCSNIGKEQFWCSLLILQSPKVYYVKAYVINEDGNVIYGQTESLTSQSFNRYDGRSDYANVWYAFDYTLFDLVTDEIINPQNGFFYSTNENPTIVRHQVGTSYNTCYKFATEWNYKLWYYHSIHSDKEKQVNCPIATFSNGALTIEKNPLDANKSITIYYSINGNYLRPETYTEVYTGPIEIAEPCAVYFYAISSDEFISYTGMYVVNDYTNGNNNDDTSSSDKIADIVDLGLSVKWASWNVGADKPEAFGNLYAWGELSPKTDYSISTYKFYSDNYTKYGNIDNKYYLDAEDDVAKQKWGGNWRMPTYNEFQELKEKCTFTETEINGIPVTKVVGPNGNYIYFPYPGNYTDNTLYFENYVGSYWSSNLESDSYAKDIDFTSGMPSLNGDSRYHGQAVRPVYEDETESHDVDSDFVDLGLSSGTLWATCNIGASTPEEYGDYFAWGETSPKRNYDWSSYKFGQESSFSKYNTVDGLTQLELEDDAAYVILGKEWRMPTHEEELELAKECSWESVILNGISGYKITGPNGNSIFMPRGGLYDGTDYACEGSTLSNVNTCGWYWSSTLNSKGSSYAQGLCFYPSLIENVVDHERCDGHNIRPVYVGIDGSTGKVADIVDLGLSVSWASWNIGAGKPEGLGDLYAWGELAPKSDYSSSTYKFYNSSYTKYGTVDNKYRLEEEDDVAQQLWGNNWRMPTIEELNELKEKCTFTQTELNGVPVTKVTGPNGNFIYFPYPGNYTDNTLYFKNSVGSYWSSDLESDSYAKDIDFISGMPSVNGDTRYHGQSIRPVYSKASSAKYVIHLETAGTLAENISTSESNDILDLTITGHMDARDFDFIKWHCMKVENVDISGVKIDAYSGADGTNEGYNDTYAANEIPLGAFFYWTSSNKYDYEGMPSDEGMPSLKKIKLPDGIKAIRRNAFARAYNLTEINIPEGVEAIDYVAFAVCTSLETIVLPSSLKEVGTTAFADVSSLKTMYVNAINPPICSSDAFLRLPDNAVLYVPKGAKASYQTANGWNTFNTIEEIGDIEQEFEMDGVKYKIGESNTVSVTNKNNGYSGDIIIPVQVTYNGSLFAVTAIENNAFDDCKNLGVLFLPQAIYNVGIPGTVTNFVTYSKNPMRIGVKSKGATSAVLDIDPFNEKGSTTITMLGLTPGQQISWKLDDENYGIMSDKTEASLLLTVQPAQPTSTTKARLTAIVNEVDDDLHYGFEWLRNDAPDNMPSNVVSVPLNNGRLAGSLGGLNPDIYYKYRPFYMSDSGEKYYGNWTPFLTGDANVFFEPETHTKEATELTQNSAVLAAVWVEGTEDIEEKGFEFWPLSVHNARAATRGVMTVIVKDSKSSVTVDGLSADTEYSYRAYVKTASGTMYGEEVLFKTNMAGDVNNDGIINEKDLKDLTSHIMGKKPLNFNEKMADLNNDQKVNVVDVVVLINLIHK